MMKLRGFLTITCLLLFAFVAFAGRAHFVGVPQFTADGTSLVASGKVAGLGDVPQISVTVSATAECINPGGNNPNASNKESFSATGTFPVQNGKALFVLDLEATFQPSCTPPMSVSWSDISLVVTADDGTLLTFP